MDRPDHDPGKKKQPLETGFVYGGVEIETLENTTDHNIGYQHASTAEQPPVAAGPPPRQAATKKQPQAVDAAEAGVIQGDFGDEAYEAMYEAMGGVRGVDEGVSDPELGGASAEKAAEGSGDGSGGAKATLKTGPESSGANTHEAEQLEAVLQGVDHAGLGAPGHPRMRGGVADAALAFDEAAKD